MEEVKNNTGQNLGIAALIVAIITFVLAVIPCVGLIAPIPGIIAIILAAVGLSQAARNNAPRGVLIAGLIIGIIAVLISVSQIFVAGKIASNSGKWPTDIQNVIDDVQDHVMKNIEDANVSIKVQNGEDKVEINTNSSEKKKMEKTLENLEEGKEGADTVPDNDTITKK
ncbi:MAG TPA: hypothetical protein VJ963_13585 [Bacteroidales bacterium]|nr:hypothetical protein [Bacteroidales bacterium]